uniref:1-phosphatidylinositol 4,5-bisphosphate phosphodiesterase classes I and II n=1 Tax=Cacopsylla melanoneura TaxID=428564 RepID=A0A8D8UQL2_9HEMI
MMSAKTSTVDRKVVEIPQCMLDGEKFMKWDEDNGLGIPVTLKVDPKGFYLYWEDQNKEIDILDIATIRDTRTGKQSKIPKDPKLRQLVTMGSQDTLKEKTATICCGADFVNLSFVNFCTTKKEIAENNKNVCLQQGRQEEGGESVGCHWFSIWEGRFHRIIKVYIRRVLHILQKPNQ